MKEIWKPIRGYEGLYQVSNFGRVKSLERIIHTNTKTYFQATRKRKIIIPVKAYSQTRYKKEKILTKNIDEDGYVRVGLFKNSKLKTFRVGRLVALHFIANPFNKTQVNHVDGNKKNNYYENLEWTTPKENTRHAHRIGLVNYKGQLNSQSKLKNKDITIIKQLRNIKFLSYSQIAEKFNVSNACIQHIIQGRSWKFLRKLMPMPR